MLQQKAKALAPKRLGPVQGILYCHIQFPDLGNAFACLIRCIIYKKLSFI